MYLTDDEKQMLEGERGEIVQKCMRVLVKLGEIYHAERMIPIRNVHTPGVSYRVTGEAGLNYVVNASKEAHFCAPTTLNTIGVDCEKWAEIGFDKEFAKRQFELMDAYRAMGSICVNTCTPYLSGNIPMFGESIAWGESSAVAFINSYMGARTNREGGPTALAAAITGRVPAYGLHLDENRKGQVLIQLDMHLETDKDFAVLGYFIGSSVGTTVPVIDGMDHRPTLETFKALSAAVASSGAVALYHMVGYTPEAPTKEAVIGDVEPVYFGQLEYDKVCEKFGYTGKIDFVVLGCPHVSIVEMGRIADLLTGKKVKAELWVCASRHVKDLGDQMGSSASIEKAGGTIVCDTCPVLCCKVERGYKSIATNSGKMAHYAPGLWKLSPALLHMEQCIQAAIEGEWKENV